MLSELWWTCCATNLAQSNREKETTVSPWAVEVEEEEERALLDGLLRTCTLLCRAKTTDVRQLTR